MSVVLCSGSQRNSPLVLLLRSGLILGVSVDVKSNTESCDKDGEEVGLGVVEELADKPGTTNGT